MVKDREFYKTIFRIALPAALQSLISFLVVVVDDIMVSSLENGVYAQAAVSQVNSITAFYTATVTGLIGGSAVLISQYWGKQDRERIKRIFSIVLVLCLLFSLLVLVLAKGFPQALVGIVVRRGDLEVTGLALAYLSIACVAYVPYALSASLVGMLRTIEVVTITLYTAVISLFVNVGCNYVLIFGKLGFPALGVRGAALATLVTRLVELALVWFYTFYVQRQLRVRPRELLRLDTAMLRDYIRYGVPVGVVDMQWSLIGMLKAAIVGQMGAVFIAAANIANSMTNLGMIFSGALAGGACVVVGKAVGQRDYTLARAYSKTIQLLFFLIGLVMAAAVFFLRRPFVSLYGSAADPQVYSLSTTLVAITAVTLVGSCYHASCFVGINRGAGDSRFVALVDMICGWLIVLPATLLAAFVFHWSLPAVFLCTRIDQCFKWVIAFFRLRGDRWIRNVTRD